MASSFPLPKVDPTDAFLREVLKDNPYIDLIAPIPKPSEFGRPLKGDLGVALPKAREPIPLPSQFGRRLEPDKPVTYPLQSPFDFGNMTPEESKAEVTANRAAALDVLGKEGILQPGVDGKPPVFKTQEDADRYNQNLQFANAKIAKPIGGMTTEMLHQYTEREHQKKIADAAASLKETDLQLSGDPNHPMPKFTPARDAFDRAVSGLATIPPEMLKSIGIIAGNPWTGPMMGIGEKNALTHAADVAEKAIYDAFPGDPTRANTFLSQFGSGAGSMTGFFLAGYLGRLIKLGAMTTSALTGAMSQAPSGYEDAVRHGAGPAARYVSFLANAGLGATEALTIDRFFMRLDKGTGGSVTKALEHGYAQGMEELIQELGQSLGTDVVAKYAYDPQRKVGDGALEQGGIGFILGALMGTAIGFHRGEPPPPTPLEGEIIPPDHPGPGARTDRGAPIIDMAAGGPAPPSGPLGLPSPTLGLPPPPSGGGGAPRLGGPAVDLPTVPGWPTTEAAPEAALVKEPPIVKLRQDAAQIESTLTPPVEGMTRLWRGNRPGEVGAATTFTNDLPGIALPFRKAYGGDLSYIDVPTADLGKYVQTGAVAPGAEFNVPADMAKTAKTVPAASEFATPKGRRGKKVDPNQIDLFPPEGPATTGSIRTQVPPVVEEPQPMPGEEPAVLPPVPGPRFLLQKDYPAGRMGYDPAVRFEGKVYTGEMHADAVAKAMEDNPNFEAAFEANPEAYLGYQEGSAAQNARVSEATAPAPTVDLRAEAIQEARQAVAGVPPPAPPQQPAGVPAVVPPTPSPPPPDELDAQMAAALEAVRGRQTDPLDQQMAAQLGTPIQLGQQSAPAPPEPGMTRLYRAEPVGDSGWASQDSQDAPGRWSENPRDALDWYHQDQGGIAPAQSVFIDVPTQQAEQYRARNLSPRAQRFSKNPGTEFFLPSDIAANRRPIPPGLVPQAQTAPSAPTVAPTEVSGGAVPLPSQFGRPLSEVATRRSPLKVGSAADTELAGQNVATPSGPQAKAGNYQMGHLRWPIVGTRRSLSLSVETPAGGVRQSKDPEVPWEAQTPVAYGYAKGTKGGEGKPFDIYIGPNPQAPNAFVIDQINPDTGKYDEGKGFVGFDTREQAVQAYVASFSDGRGVDRIGAVSRMPAAEFEKWVRSDKSTKPFDRAGVREARKQRVAASIERAAAPPANVEQFPTPAAPMVNVDIGSGAGGLGTRNTNAWRSKKDGQWYVQWKGQSDLSVSFPNKGEAVAYIQKRKAAEDAAVPAPQTPPTKPETPTNVVKFPTPNETFTEFDDGTGGHSGTYLSKNDGQWYVLWKGRADRDQSFPSKGEAMAYMEQRKATEGAPPKKIISTPADAAWWDSLPIEDRDAILNEAGVMRSPELSWKTLGEANQQKILAATQGEGLKDETRAVKEPSDVTSADQGRRSRGGKAEPQALQGAEPGREGATAGGVSTPEVSRLPGLPRQDPGGLRSLVEAAKEYLDSVGIPYRRQSVYAVADPQRGKRIADAYAAMTHAPTNRRVLAAYNAMIKETMAQYQAIKKLGIKFDVIPPGEDPYPRGPRQALEDLRDNNHWWLFPTVSGYGTLEKVETNPLLGLTDEYIGDYRLTHNDVFRIVHDLFGHAREGVGFGKSGEENAWQSHMRMYSPLAARAMTVETRGQNSWVNFGPYGEKNQADQKNTVYADQKSGLLPEWVSTEGVVPDAETVRSDTRQAGEEDVVRRGAEPRGGHLQQQAQGQPSDRAERPRAPAQGQKEEVKKGLEESTRRVIPPPGLVSPSGKPLVEGRVSTRWPTGKKGENPLSHLLDLVREHVTGTPNVDLLHYVGMGVPKDAPPMERVEAYLRWTIGNILFFHDITDPDVREESKEWYEGAHRIAETWAKQYGYPLASVAGAIAVLSPQKNWFQNISLAQRILDIHTRSNDTQFTNAMGEKLHKDLKGLVDSYPKQVAAISNAKLKDLIDPVERALWIRIYDETYNDRRYRVAHASGRFGGFEKTLAGKLADVAWGGLNEISKADQMLRSDGKLDRISFLLGYGHKVRSFFNNIHVPWDQVFLDATMDTHSVGVGHFSPLGGTSLEVGHVLGTGAGPKSQFDWAQPQLDVVRKYAKKYGKVSWKEIKDWEENNPEQFANWMQAYQDALQSINVTKLGPSRDAQTGVKGLYPLLLLAHRTAAPQRGLLARQIQSITWDKIRKVFTPAQKRDPAFRAHIFGIWRQVDAGTLSEDDARRQIVDFANQGKAPETASKNQPGFESYAPTEVSTYEEGVHTPKLVRKTTEGSGRGGAEGARPSTVAKQEVDTYDPYAVGVAARPRKPRKPGSGLEDRTLSVDPPPGKLLFGHTHLGPWGYDDALPMGGQAQDYIRQQGIDNKVEYLLAIDANGQVVAHGYGDENSTGFTKNLDDALHDPSKSVALHHYHPSGLSFSTADMAIVGLPGAHSVWAYGPEGNVYRAAVTEAYRKWLMPHGKRNWFNQTKKIADLANEDVLAKLQEAVDAYKVDYREATSWLNHLRSIVLHNAGIIDYDSNVDASAFIAKAGLQSHLDSLSDKYAKAVFNGPGRTTNRYGVHRPTVALRHAGEVGTTFKKDAELARERSREAKRNRDRQEADSGEARPQSLWQKLGLAEDTQEVTNPFGPNSRPAKQPIFYSAVVRAVEKAQLPKATPQQWMGYLRNQPNVKPEELDWLGVEDWLNELAPDLSPNPARAEIQRQLENVPASEERRRQSLEKKLETLPETVRLGTVSQKQLEEFVRANELTVSETVYSQEHGTTKWDPLQHPRLNVPGGENSIELLIQLQDKGKAEREEAIRVVRDRLNVIRAEEDKLRWRTAPTESGEEIKKLRELKAETSSLHKRLRDLQTDKPPVYVNPDHWEAENVVAWHRFDERIIPATYTEQDQADRATRQRMFEEEVRPINKEIQVLDAQDDDPRLIDLLNKRDAVIARMPRMPDPKPKRILFEQENQSDMHQKGRELGYRPRPGRAQPSRSIEDIRTEFDEALKQDDYLGYSNATQARGAIIGAPRDFADRWEMSPNTVALAKEYLDARAGLGIDNRIPDAPFKSTWHELSIKRILRWAVDNGFDGIAWTTGQMQHDRYPGLVKTIENIVYEPSGESSNLLTVTAQTKDGTIVGNIFGKSMSAKELVKTFGQEVADRMLASEGGSSIVGGKPVKVIDGLEIQHGGKMHLALYNEKWPQFLNKLGKKYGAKVETINLPVPQEGPYSTDRNPDGSWVVLDDNGDEFITRDQWGDPLSQQEAEDQAREINAENEKLGNKQVPYFGIPDAMREAVKEEPFGLFQATRTVRPPGVPPTPAQRRSFIQRLLSGGILDLDLPFRIPFEIFGGTDEFGRWNYGKYLNKKAGKIISEASFNENGKFAWLNPLMHNARMGLINRYQLDPAYIERTRQAQIEEGKLLRRGQEFMKMLKRADIGVAEAKVLKAILTGERATDAQWQAISEPIRNAIDLLGQEMVSLGLISQESYQRHRGAYLHRVYMKYEADAGELGRFMSRMGSQYRRGLMGPELKRRGKTRGVTLDRLLKDSTDKSTPQKTDKFRVFKKVTTDRLGRVQKRYIYLRGNLTAPMPQSAVSAGFTDNGIWEVVGVKRGKIILWQDFTKSERQAMGEIVDARYLILKTYMLVAHDISTGKLYRDIAANLDWTTLNPGTDPWKDASEYSRFWNDPSVMWVKVPDTTIAKSNVKRWGALAGKYVRAPIWRDIAELHRMQEVKWWEPLIRKWKINKTARSPVTHMNNVMGNAILMDMDDVRARDLVRGITAVYRENALYQRALDNGAFGSDYLSQELQRDWMQPLLKEVQDDMAGPGLQSIATIWDKILTRLWSRGALYGTAVGATTGMMMGGPAGAAIGGAIGGVAGMAAKRPVAAVDDFIVSRYGWEDKIFRMATFIRRVAEGATDAEAAREAHEQFLNYDIRAPYVNALRRGPVPFIGYTSALVPRLAEGLTHRPWKPMKYITALTFLAWLALQWSGDDDDDEEKERRSMDERDQGNISLGPIPIGPKMFRTGAHDKYDNPIYLDIRRGVPGGDILDMGQLVPFLPQALQLSGPLLMAMEQMMNKSAFTGDPIVNTDVGTLWDHAGQRFDHLWKGWMPNAIWMPGSWAWDKVVNAGRGYEDYHHRPISLTGAVLSGFGIKVRPVDAAMNFEFYQIRFNKTKDAIEAEMRRIDRDVSKNRISKFEADRQKKSLIQQKLDLGRRKKEVFQSPKQRTAEEAKAAAKAGNATGAEYSRLTAGTGVERASVRLPRPRPPEAPTPEDEIPVGPTSLEETSAPEEPGWFSKTLLGSEQEKYYPTPAEGREAIRTGQFYGETVEPFTAKDASKVLATKTTDDALSLANTGEAPLKSGPPTDALSNLFAQAGIAVRKSGVATLGFDPRHVVTGNKGENLTVAGFYLPSKDMIWIDPAYASVMVHESIHRGLKQIYKKYPSVVPVGQREELIVRRMMENYFGDSEKGRGELGDTQVQLSEIYGDELDPIIAKLEKAAQREIGLQGKRSR